MSVMISRPTFFATFRSSSITFGVLFDWSFWIFEGLIDRPKLNFDSNENSLIKISSVSAELALFSCDSIGSEFSLLRFAVLSFKFLTPVVTAELTWVIIEKTNSVRRVVFFIFTCCNNEASNMILLWMFSHYCGWSLISYHLYMISDSFILIDNVDRWTFNTLWQLYLQYWEFKDETLQFNISR